MEKFTPSTGIVPTLPCVPWELNSNWLRDNHGTPQAFLIVELLSGVAGQAVHTYLFSARTFLYTHSHYSAWPSSSFFRYTVFHPTGQLPGLPRIPQGHH